MSDYRIRYDERGNIILDSLHVEEAPVVEEQEEQRISETWLVESNCTSKGDDFVEHIEKNPNPNPPRTKQIPLNQSLRSGSGQAKTKYQFPRKVREGLRFAGTFTAIFLFLFVSLNFGSYFQMARAFLLPSEVERERAALERAVSPLSRNNLLNVPELPRAGADLHSPLIAAIDVTAPDNRIVIPKIGKNIPLVEVADDAVKRGDWKMFGKDIQHALRFGAVRYPGTAVPGQIGNVFVTAHSSNYPFIPSNYNDAFALLPTLEIGDTYSIIYNGEVYHYRIAEKYEVSPKNVAVLDQPSDKLMSTLMTCTPVGTTLRRMILHAEEIDPVTGLAITVQSLEDYAVPNLEWGGELAI